MVHCAQGIKPIVRWWSSLFSKLCFLPNQAIRLCLSVLPCIMTSPFRRNEEDNQRWKYIWSFTTFIRILGFPILTESTLKQKRCDQATILKRWIGAFSCLSQLQLLLQNDVYSWLSSSISAEKGWETHTASRITRRMCGGLRKKLWHSSRSGLQYSKQASWIACRMCRGFIGMQSYPTRMTKSPDEDILC